MTAVPQVLAAAAKERISADVPADVAHRLRVWAALRRTKTAHIVSELVCEAVPSEDQLAAQMQQTGATDDRAR
jgi:hypothetical protein